MNEVTTTTNEVTTTTTTNEGKEGITMKKASARIIRNDSAMVRNAIIDYKKLPSPENMEKLSTAIVTLADDMQVTSPAVIDVFAFSTTCKRKGNANEGYTFYWDVKSDSQVRSFFLPHVDTVRCEYSEIKENTPRTPRTPHVETPHEKAVNSAFGIAKRAAKKLFDETHALDDNSFTFPAKADWSKDPANVEVINAMEKLFAA